MCSAFFEFPRGECGVSVLLTCLPNASETMSNLSSTSSSCAFKMWVRVQNKPEQSEQFCSFNGMMLMFILQVWSVTT